MAYTDYINSASAEFGVPADIIRSVIQVESSGDPTAIGRAGEQGLMQIMPATGRELGLTNPFNAQENIRAGAKYLSQQYKTAGNWRDALGRYNAGKYYNGAQGQAYADKVLAGVAGGAPDGETKPMDIVIKGGQTAQDIAENADDSFFGGKPWYEKMIDYVLGLLGKGALKLALGILAILFIVLGVWKLVKS